MPVCQCTTLVKDNGISCGNFQVVHSVKIVISFLSCTKHYSRNTTFNLHLGLKFSSKYSAEKPWIQAQKSGSLCPLVELLFMGTNTAVCINPTPQEPELFNYEIRCGEPVMPSHKEIQLSFPPDSSEPAAQQEPHSSHQWPDRYQQRPERSNKISVSTWDCPQQDRFWEISQLIFPGKQLQDGDFSHGKPGT